MRIVNHSIRVVNLVHKSLRRIGDVENDQPLRTTCHVSIRPRQIDAVGMMQLDAVHELWIR